MKTVKALCEPAESVFTNSKADTIASIGDLKTIDAEAFFRENHVTEGMKTLLCAIFERLLGAGPQGVFRLKQAMGGGKTHNLIATGLLARNPSIRQRIMSEIGRSVPPDEIRVAAFDGRETDKREYLWVDLFRRLDVLGRWKGGATSDPPSPQTWASVLGSEPLLLMLDEMPPYLEALSTNQASPTASEADRTAIGLANLMVAITEGRLPRCAMIITDLISSWQRGSEKLNHAFEQSLKNLNDETSKFSLSIQPVRLDGNEIYSILRKRLFSKLPEASEIAVVEKAYDQAFNVAIQQNVIPESSRRWITQIRDTYPFHPGLEDLIARFRENPSFQQTREVIRIAKKLIAGAWSLNGANGSGPLLIHPHMLDFSDSETDNLLDQINSSLQNARSHDIWKNGGGAAAEELSQRRSSTLPVDVAKLVYLSSLSTATNATLGLRHDEVAAYLCAPEREVASVSVALLQDLEDNTVYLHRRTDQRWYFRDTKNLHSAIKDRASMMRDDERKKEIKSQLNEIFKPGRTANGAFVYQKLLVFPAPDDIEVDSKQIVLIIAEPTETGLDSDLRDLWKGQTYRNRLMYLTGTKAFNNAMENVAYLKAVRELIKQFEDEGKDQRSPEFVQAKSAETRYGGYFLSALRETFTALYYPYENDLKDATLRFEFAANKFDAEQTIAKTLKEESKYRDDTADEAFVSEFEGEIFNPVSRPWNDMVEQTARDPNWYWYRPAALEEVKSNAISRGHWRDDGPGRVRRGPFPKEKTSVLVKRIERDPDTGEVLLHVEAKFGDRVHWDTGDAIPTSSSPVVERGQLRTRDMRVSFVAIDSTGQHETGPTVPWTNELEIKYRFSYRDGKHRLELKSIPHGAAIRYTTDGSNPRQGGVYSGTVDLPSATLMIEAIAEKDGVASRILQLDPPRSGASNNEAELTIDPGKPAVWNRRIKRDGRKASFDALQCLGRAGAKLGGIDAMFSDPADQDRWYQIGLGERSILEADELERLLLTVPEILVSGWN